MNDIDLMLFRRKFKLNQSECAEALGCSVRSIANWESSRLAIPDYIGLAASAYAHSLPSWGGRDKKIK